MTKASVIAMIKRRSNISKRASFQAARDGATKMMDYHSGCMGVCACLLADVVEAGRKKRRR